MHSTIAVDTLTVCGPLPTAQQLGSLALTVVDYRLVSGIQKLALGLIGVSGQNGQILTTEVSVGSRAPLSYGYLTFFQHFATASQTNQKGSENCHCLCLFRGKLYIMFKHGKGDICIFKINK